MKQKTLLSDQENPRPSGRGEVNDLLAHIGRMFPDAIEELEHRINRKRQEA